MGILLLTGFIFIGIAFSVVTSSALSGLLLLAFGLLLIFSVLEFLSNEMMVTFGNAVQENRGSQWTARIGQFVDKYSLIFWMVASSSVVLLTFLQISNGFPIWLFVAMGLFQQIILKSRKLVAIWWALCWILGLISGFLAMLLLVWLFPSLNSSSSLSSIMVCVLIGVFSGIYQWLILRKNQVKAARWWILVSAISGLVFAPTFNSGSNFYLPALLALGYSVVTGLSMEWLLKHQVESSLNLGKFLIRMPLWTKVITAAALILIIFFSIEIWETRKLSDFPFSVSSASSWADTGLSLEPGNRVEIQYLSGQWSIDPTNSEDGKYTDANGVQYSTPSKWCLGCGAPDPAGTLGMLYATLSPATGNNVAVGDYSSFTVQQAGDLYLMINDSYGNLADNSGSIIVQIRVYNR